MTGARKFELYAANVAAVVVGGLAVCLFAVNVYSSSQTQEPVPAMGTGVVVHVEPTSPKRTVTVDLAVLNDATLEFTRGNDTVSPPGEKPILLREIARKGIERHEIDPLNFSGALGDEQIIQVTTRVGVIPVTVGELRRYASTKKPQPNRRE